MTQSGQARLSFALDADESFQVPQRAVRQTAPLSVSELEPLEQAIFGALGNEPMHMDVICVTVGASLPSVVGALLTLTLQTVVVEGPDGCYRRVNR